MRPRDPPRPECEKKGSWKCAPRKRTLIGSADKMLSMPDRLPLSSTSQSVSQFKVNSGLIVKSVFLRRLLILKVIIISRRSIGVAKTWWPWPIAIAWIYTTTMAKRCHRTEPTCFPNSMKSPMLNGAKTVSTISSAARGKYYILQRLLWLI